jgi:hypothetical protein
MYSKPVATSGGAAAPMEIPEHEPPEGSEPKAVPQHVTAMLSWIWLAYVGFSPTKSPEVVEVM